MIGRFAAIVLAVLLAIGPLTPAFAETSHVHGTIVIIDAKQQQVQIHHDPFPPMPMVMTMIFQVPDKAVFSALRVGMVVDADVDLDKTPWSLSNIKIATPKASASP